MSEEIIAIACDHAGFPVKDYLCRVLRERGYKLADYGTNSEESVDYPDMIHPLASDISKGKIQRGIIICGSGNGVSMTANKYPGVRAALCWIPELAKLARQHNDANILALPGRYVTREEARDILEAFLATGFEGGRHQRRVEKVNIPSKA